MCLKEADAGAQAGHHLDPIIVLVEIVARCGPPGRARANQQFRVHGEIEIRRRGWVDSEEFRWGDANHGEWDVIDQNGLTHGSRCSAETFLAETDIEDSDRGRARTVVIGNDEAASGGTDAEPTKVISGYIFAAGNFSLTVDHQIQALGRVVGEDTGENCTGILLEELKCREREDSGDGSGCGIVLGTAADGTHDRNPRHLGVPFQHDQGIRIRYGKRAQQNGIHEAVNRGIGPNAKGEGESGKQGERRIAPHYPRGVAEVLDELLQKRPGPHGAGVLF